MNAIKIFRETPGNFEDKYEAFITLLKTFLSTFGDANTQTVQYYRFVGNVSKNTYRAFTNPSILLKLNHSQNELNDCYESSWNESTAVKGNDFCGFVNLS